MPPQAYKFRFAWVDCVEPLCESAARNNIVEDEIEPNKFVLADCRVKTKEMVPNRKHASKWVFDGGKDRKIEYTVVDGGKMRYPTNIRDRIKECSVSRTPWSRPMNQIMESPSCVVKSWIRLQKCNTCCCRKGLVSTSVSLALIQGSQQTCGTWLSVVDWFVRSYVSFIRMITVVDRYGGRCFNKVYEGNTNKP